MSRDGIYDLLTSLPPLAEPGSQPPLAPAELRARASESTAAALVDAVLLSDDLRRRQARLAGEIADFQPLIMAPDQAAGWAPLPRCLGLAERVEPAETPYDEVWAAYWRYAARTARRQRSRFLDGWVRLEVGLRNGLAAARAQALGRPDQASPVAPELAATDPRVGRALAAWSVASDPLTGWRGLLRARWEWATGAIPYFTFHKDEVAGYAVRLLILTDWRRTLEGTEPMEATGNTGTAETAGATGAAA